MVNGHRDFIFFFLLLSKCGMIFEMQSMYQSACMTIEYCVCAKPTRPTTRRRWNKFYLLQLLNIVSIECNLWCDFSIIRPMWYSVVQCEQQLNSNFTIPQWCFQIFVYIYRCDGKKSKRLWSNLKWSSHVQHITIFAIALSLENWKMVEMLSRTSIKRRKKRKNKNLK